MQLALTAEEATFRDELRTFFATEIPAEIRERSRLGLPVTRDDIVTSHKILHEHGLAVPHWPPSCSWRWPARTRCRSMRASESHRQCGRNAAQRTT
jgi:hypothetical protein